MKRSSFAKGVAALAAGAMTLALGGAAAQAQPYGQYAAPPAPGYGYATCHQEANSRGLLGALVGGGLGAVVGSHMAANHHRSDGGLVGAGLGALLGAGVGHSSANCAPNGYAEAPPPPPPPPEAYAQPPVSDWPPPPPPPVAYAPPPPPAYYEPPADVVVYGYRGEPLRVAGPIGPDGCAWARGPVAGPYGVEPGWVRVCRGWHGRFHVVG